MRLLFCRNCLSEFDYDGPRKGRRKEYCPECAPRSKTNIWRECGLCGERFKLRQNHAKRSSKRQKCYSCSPTRAQNSRDEKGKFLKGTFLPEPIVKKISEGQIKRHLLRIKEETDALPSKKKCSKKDCSRAGQWLNVPDDFPMRTRKLKSGLSRVYPAGECKRCANVRKIEHKKKYIAKHGIDAWRDKQKVYNSRRNLEHKKVYNRMYQRRMRAKQAGVQTRGPWKRYRHELEPEAILLPATQFVEWWDSLNGSTPWLSSQDQRFIYRLRSGEITEVDWYFVDRVTTDAGQIGMVYLLYPDA